MGIDLLTSFSVTTKDPTDKNAESINYILAAGEELELAYSHKRDKVWFTNKRIITLDIQGLTGSKKEYRSFPYSKISSFSIETAGTFDGDSDFKIWVSGVGVFEIKFKKSIDIKEIGTFLSAHIM